MTLSVATLAARIRAEILGVDDDGREPSPNVWTVSEHAAIAALAELKERAERLEANQEALVARAMDQSMAIEAIYRLAAAAVTPSGSTER